MVLWPVSRYLAVGSGPLRWASRYVWAVVETPSSGGATSVRRGRNRQVGYRGTKHRE